MPVLYFDMNLIIDAGNSFLKYFVFSDDTLVEHDIISYAELNHFDFSNLSCKKAIICNVSKIDTQEIMSHFPGVSFLEFKHDTQTLISNKYETPATLGLDRLAAANGAEIIAPEKNKLIIDLGTAITIDFVDKDANYIGGNISVGMSSRFRALHDYTQNLPLLSPTGKTKLTGKNTIEAIQNGVILGICNEIDGYIKSYSSIYQDITTFLTGGDCLFFEKRVKNSIFAQPNLVAIGLNAVLTYNETI